MAGRKMITYQLGLKQTNEIEAIKNEMGSEMSSCLKQPNRI